MNSTLVYNGHGITFHLNEKLMVNATDMAKIFDRRPNDFLCLESTKRFIDAAYPPDFSNTTKNGKADIQPIVTIKGGDYKEIKPGTWFHEDLAMKFAAWLSPHFEVWMIRHTKELLKTGVTTMGSLPEDEQILQAMQILQRRVIDQLRQLELAENTIQQQKPAVIFTQAVQSSQTSILVADLAKILKKNGVEIGQNRLFEWLRKNAYLGSRGGYYNKPTQMAMEMGLFEVSEVTINRPDKDPIIGITSKVTGKGQLYFVNKFLKQKFVQYGK
jgi:anti-repressor protein